MQVCGRQPEGSAQGRTPLQGDSPPVPARPRQEVWRKGGQGMRKEQGPLTSWLGHGRPEYGAANAEAPSPPCAAPTASSKGKGMAPARKLGGRNGHASPATGGRHGHTPTVGIPWGRISQSWRPRDPRPPCCQRGTPPVQRQSNARQHELDGPSGDCAARPWATSSGRVADGRGQRWGQGLHLRTCDPTVHAGSPPAQGAVAQPTGGPARARRASTKP